MPLRESELEYEYEDETELESEFEGEEEGEEFLGSLARGLLGEGEFEQEFEGEEEGEEFLGSLGGLARGLLGQGEGEYEGEFEDESEEFFGNIARFVRRNAGLLKRVARIAAPMVGTALGGPLGGALGNMAARALGEGEGEYEFEAEFEDEAEDEYEQELEAELESEASHAMTEAEALAEMMAAVAAGAQSEAEAEAMIGAATVTVLSPRDRAELRRLVPHLVRGSCVLTRILRRQRRVRPAVRAVPYIVQRTGRVLARRAADGRPIDRRVAARVMSRQTRAVLGSPRRTSVALRRNVRATNTMRRYAGRGYAGRRNWNGAQRRRSYSYR
jgi:hypothetical protein